MSRRPGGAQSAPLWQRSILAVNLFLLARGGVAAGLVVQATRNHATDSEQEEGDGQHWSSCAASRVARRARAPARDSLSANYVSWPDCLITKYRSRDPHASPLRRLAAVCVETKCSHCVFERRTLYSRTCA